MTSNPLAKYLLPRYGSGRYSVDVKISADYIDMEPGMASPDEAIETFQSLLERNVIGDAVYLHISNDDVTHDVSLGCVFGLESNCAAFVSELIRYYNTDGEKGIPTSHTISINTDESEAHQ